MIIREHLHCLLCDSTKLIALTGYESAYLCRCKNCGFVFSRRVPENKELEEYYGVHYSRTNYLSPITVVRYCELLDEFEKFRKTNRLLDVGSGCGFLLEIAKDRGWEVYGTELTDEMIALGNQKGFQMRQGDISSAGFNPEMFDIITCIEVLEHLNNPKEVVEEMFTILRPGGKVYLTTPNFNSLLRYRLKSAYDVIEYPNHLSYYTPKTLRQLFSKRFKVEKISTTGYSLTRSRTSRGKSNQEYVSETSDDEMLRYKIEHNRLLRFGKKLINGGLNLLRVGDSIKASFVKPEKQ